MKMTNRELETRYIQMKLTWKNLVNANVDLVDENKMLKGENERLNNIINELEKWIEEKSQEYRFYNEHDKADILDIASYKLQELKGSDEK